MVMRSGKERGWRAKSYGRHKRMEASISFSLIRLLILHPYILHLLYLHILHLQNHLYLVVSTYSLYYTVALDSGSKARYVRHLGLGI